MCSKTIFQKALMQLLCYWFVFRSVCFVADLNYSLELIPPGTAVDSFSDIKGKKPHYSVTCYLFQIQFRGNNVFPGTLLCLSWEKKYKLNFTHRKQFPDRKLCLISTEDVGKLQPTPRRLYFNKFAKLAIW